MGGCVVTEALKPSMNAAATWGEEYLMDPYVRQEFCITIGILAIIVQSVAKAYLLGERERWAGVFGVFFRLMQLVYKAVCMLIVSEFGKHRDLCEAREEGSAKCIHAYSALEQLPVSAFRRSRLDIRH